MNWMAEKPPLMAAVLFTSIAIFSQVASAATAEHSPGTIELLDERLTSIRSELIEIVESGAAPSFAVGVLKDGELLWREAYGWADIENRKAATPQTAYRLASLGKSVTATAVMTLVQGGKIDLDAPIDTYFDEGLHLTAHEGGRALTVRDVLQMTAAIPHGGLTFRSKQAFARYTTAELIRNRGFLIFPPGDAYVYSNFAYGVLEHAIEHVSGLTFAQYLGRAVYESLGMHQSLHFGDAPKSGVVLASLYDTEGRRVGTEYSVPQSSLGLYASLEDLLRYSRLHLGQLLDDQWRILDREWVERMHTDHPDLPGVDALIALGWGSVDLDGSQWLVSNGRATGAQSTLSLLPSESLAVVCLTNITGNKTDEMAFRITDALVPGFMARLGGKIAAWESHMSPPFEPVPRLLGDWEGAIATGQGEVPIALRFQVDGDVHVTLEDQHTTLLNRVRYEDGLLTGEFVGECAFEQPVDHPHEIQLGLRYQDGRLSGYAKSVFANEAGSFALPGYVSLARTAPREDQSP